MLSLSLSFDDELPLAVVIRIAAATTTAKEEADDYKFTTSGTIYKASSSQVIYASRKDSLRNRISREYIY